MTEFHLFPLGMGVLRQSHPISPWLPLNLLCGLRKPSWKGCRAAGADDQASHYSCRSHLAVSGRSFSFCGSYRLSLNYKNTQGN